VWLRWFCEAVRPRLEHLDDGGEECVEGRARPLAFELQLHDEWEAEEGAPVLTFCATEAALAAGTAALVPDFEWVQRRGVLDAVAAAAAAAPWGARKRGAVWRGTTAASHADNMGRDGCPAVRDARGCLDADGRPLPRALFVRLVQERRLPVDVGGARLSPSDMCGWRTQVDIDGHSASWQGCLWKLASGSAIIKHASRWRMWYSGLVEPWQHFVPCRADFGDLAAALAWCDAHDEEARAIGERGAARLREAIDSDEAGVQAALDALRWYAARQTP
jgi:hypothetical protein